MRTAGLLVGLLSIGTLVWGCDAQPMCGGEDLGNGKTSCTERGDGGSGGVDQFVDAQGICRSAGDFAQLGCAQTYDLALATDRCGSARCAGTCGGWLVVQDACTPSLGCTYDPLSRALVGVVWGDDASDHCDQTSHDVTYGDGYHGCHFTDLIVDEACWLKP